jgi:hypothetical protein
MKARCSTCSRFGVPSPSSVVMRPLAEPAGKTQERIAWPSWITVQAPHWAAPQPYLALLRPTSLRNTYSSGVSGAAGLVCGVPLTLMETVIRLAPPLVAEQASGWARPGQSALPCRRASIIPP